MMLHKFVSLSCIQIFCLVAHYTVVLLLFVLDKYMSHMSCNAIC
jgi:hypothetical protein